MSSTAVPIERFAAPDLAPAEATRVSRAPRSQWLVLLLVAVSAAYVGWHLYRGWIPHDDGALAQSAERLLNGELPHRDFDDIYTGGLSYLNALAFMLFGTSFASMRLPLFGVFLAWVPAVYYLASRFVRQYAAAGVTLLAVVWSLPNYTAPMPSWYNLFFATFGLAALFRHIEDGDRRWLLAAGMAGGVSVLAKVVGLYYVAGVLLFLVFRAHAVARNESTPATSRGRGYAAFVTTMLGLFLLVLLRVLWKELHPPEAAQFFVPAACLALVIARREWMLTAGESSKRFIGLARLLIPFVAGVLLPTALFLVPYALSGSIGALIHGVFLLPMKRFTFAVVPVLPLWTMLSCVPLGVIAVVMLRARGDQELWARWVIIAAAALLLVLTVTSATVHRTAWYAARNLWPFLAAIGADVLWRERAADREQPLLQQRLAAVLAVTALCNLVQFPYFVPIYFCYVAPLVILTTVALYAYVRPVKRLVPAVVVAFYFMFAVVNVNTATVFTMGESFHTYEQTRRLTLPRGGLDVTPLQEDVYSKLIPLLKLHARGSYMWAAPDAPDVYFLAGLRNPTRTLFDFFDDTTQYTARTLRTLDRYGIAVVVLNRYPAFSPFDHKELIAAIEKEYPFATNLGPYNVRWRQ